MSTDKTEKLKQIIRELLVNHTVGSPGRPIRAKLETKAMDDITALFESDKSIEVSLEDCFMDWFANDRIETVFEDELVTRERLAFGAGWSTLRKILTNSSQLNSYQALLLAEALHKVLVQNEIIPADSKGMTCSEILEAVETSLIRT